MISMVLIIRTLAKSDSTSNEARMPDGLRVRTSRTKVSVEFMYLAGRYLVILLILTVKSI